MDDIEKKIEYYLALDWSLIHGTDLDFDKNEYHYIEIKEIPSFAFCAKTEQACIENYKKQLRLTIKVMLELEDEIPEPGKNEEDIDWESLCP